MSLDIAHLIDEVIQSYSLDVKIIKELLEKTEGKKQAIKDAKKESEVEESVIIEQLKEIGGRTATEILKAAIISKNRRYKKEDNTLPIALSKQSHKQKNRFFAPIQNRPLARQLGSSWLSFAHLGRGPPQIKMAY